MLSLFPSHPMLLLAALLFVAARSHAWRLPGRPCVFVGNLLAFYSVVYKDSAHIFHLYFHLVDSRFELDVYCKRRIR
jgi:hypothetical protein